MEMTGLEPAPSVADVLSAPYGRLRSLTATSLSPFPPWSVGARFVSRFKNWNFIKHLFHDSR